MKTTVNLEKASKILRDQVKLFKEKNWSPSSPHKGLIEDVILGNHLTYRYILFTALLAKTANPSVNPLALQAGSKLGGAYDARSLCHKVVLPLERELLDGRLGRSNEPFLNKPARFKELSIHNAVRRGRDQETLKNLISILNGLRNKSDALKALNDAIYFVFQRGNYDIDDLLSRPPESAKIDDIISFGRKFIATSCEGETCALIAGTALYLIATAYHKDANVLVHPVNQSGASSREVLDIDVYSGENLVWTAEVKDKAFARQDVDHAISKAIKAKVCSLIFITGPHATHQMNIPDVEAEWAAKGVSIHFMDIISLLKFATIIKKEASLEDFIKIIFSFSKSARTNDKVFKHLKSCL